MKRQIETISEALRRVLQESGRTTLDIEEATGVNNAVLSRFLRGERSLKLTTVDKLALHLGLKLVRTRGGRHE